MHGVSNEVFIQGGPRCRGDGDPVGEEQPRAAKGEWRRAAKGGTAGERRGQRAATSSR